MTFSDILDTTIFLISTHTLTWSVTQIAVICVLGNVISTHTLTWSVTVSKIENGIIYTISTHTLTWSVTNGKQLAELAEIFQLTRSRGA